MDCFATKKNDSKTVLKKRSQYNSYDNIHEQKVF